MEKNLIGENIIKFRKRKNMTQSELAQKLNFTYQTVSNWERGVSTPDVDSLVKLSKLFGVSIDALCGVKENSPVTEKSGYSLVKKKPALVQTLHVTKGAQLFKYSLFACIIALLANVAFLIFAKGLLSIIAIIISSVAFLVSFLIANVAVLFAKEYKENKLLKTAFLVSIGGFIAFSVISVIISNLFPSAKVINFIFVIASAVCYFSGVLVSEFVFSDKLRSACPKILAYKTAYFSLVALTVFLYFVLGATSTFISIITLWLLYKYKADKTYVCFDQIGAGVTAEEFQQEKTDYTKSQYARMLMPTSSSGIKESAFVPSVAVDNQSALKPQKISYKEFISGGLVKFYLIAILVVSIILQYSVVEYKDTNLLVGYVLLPFLFYTLAVTLKKRGSLLALLGEIALVVLLSVLGFFSYMKWYYSLPSLLIFPISYAIILGAITICFVLGYKGVISAKAKFLTCIATALITVLSVWLIVVGFDSFELAICAISLWVNQIIILVLSYFMEDAVTPY